MFLLDRFFDGTFITFGIEVLSFADRDQEDRIDPMVYVFPRMTKCTFHKFGTSGEIEKHGKYHMNQYQQPWFLKLAKRFQNVPQMATFSGTQKAI